jgi:hypothetical protein
VVAVEDTQEVGDVEDQVVLVMVVAEMEMQEEMELLTLVVVVAELVEDQVILLDLRVVQVL